MIRQFIEDRLVDWAETILARAGRFVVPDHFTGVVICGPDTTAHARRGYSTTVELVVYMPTSPPPCIHTLNGAVAYVSEPAQVVD